VEAPGTTWLWDFGDGQTSTAKNPAPHTYIFPRTYTVTLTASNTVGTSTASKQITVQTITWTPQLANPTKWNDATNWTPSGIPSATDMVVIPKTTSYPVLESTTNAEVNTIIFNPGAELGRQDLLTYEKAYVQLDFSAQSSRDRWWMLTNPLQQLFSGDFSFGGLPGMDIKAFVTETNSSDAKVGEGVWKSLPRYDHSFGAGDSFEIWLSATDLNNTNSANAGKGLNASNGIITLPYFENPNQNAVHWTHDYISATQKSTFYGGVNSGGIFARNSSPVTVTRDMTKAYKLVGLTGGELKKGLDFGKGVGGSSYFAATGNPFMSSISFEKLLSNNASLIGETYWVWVGAGANNATNPGSYATYSKTAGSLGNTSVTLSNVLPPMQSFIVERTGTTGTQITFNIVNINATGQNGNSGLKADAQSNDLLEIIASTPQSAVRAVIASRENGSPALNRMDSRKLFAGINSLPDIYMLKPDANNSMIAVAASILSEIKENILIPLGISTTYEGSITLSFAGMDTYNARIFLIDAAAPNKKEYELTGQTNYEYTFNYVSEKVNGTAVSNENRFFIRLSPNYPTNLESVTSNKILVYSHRASTIQTISGELIQQISIFNTQGQKIYDNTSVNAREHTVADLAPDVYIVKVVNKDEVKTVKIIVR
jgi:PKD repeat protein